jgi:hypothetical protein
MLTDPNKAFIGSRIPSAKKHKFKSLEMQGEITAKQSFALRRLMAQHKIWWVTLCRAELDRIKPMNKLTHAEATRCLITADIWAKSPKDGPYDDNHGRRL